MAEMRGLSGDWHAAGAPAGRPASIEAERLLHLGRQMPLVLAANLAVSPFVAYVLADALGSTGAMGWTAAVALLSLLRWSWLSLQVPPATPRAEKRLLAGHVTGSLASGLLWGFLGYRALAAGQGLQPIYALMFLCGMVSGAIGSLSTFLPVYCAFAVPAVAPVILVSAGAPDLARNVYAVATAIFLAVNIGYAAGFERTVRRSIALRFENDGLIASLEEARRAAEHESELKSRFLQSASHDLRQPLHAVTLLLADMAETGGRKDGVRMAQASVQSLAELLDRLLDASRAGSGQMKPRLCPCPLQPLLDNLVFEYAPEARRRGLDLHVVPCSLTLMTDALMLTQILRNHLANALRHARRRVLIGARRRHGHVRIEVLDDGPGIPADQHAAIFEAFYQIGNPGRDPRLGHGLGLAIVAGMARLLDARHGLRSIPGRGCAFHVELPCLPPAQTAGGPTASSAGAPQRADTRGRILLVDDQPDLRTISAAMMRRWGHDVEEADTAEAALGCVRGGFRPDVVVTDFLLGEGLDGLGLIQALRAESGTGLPALILTGNPLALTERDAHDVTVLKKPLMPGRLRAWLAATLPGPPA